MLWVKGVFSLYLSIHGLRKGPGKFLVVVLESPGKVLDFFSSERVGTLLYVYRSIWPKCCCKPWTSHPEWVHQKTAKANKGHRRFAAVNTLAICCKSVNTIFTFYFLLFLVCQYMPLTDKLRFCIYHGNSPSFQSLQLVSSGPGWVESNHMSSAGWCVFTLLTVYMPFSALRGNTGRLHTVVLT